MTHKTTPGTPGSTVLSSTLGLILAFATLPSAHPQGCSQCRETVGQAPVRTQTAYRRAITLMTLAGGSVFLASIFALKRFR